MPVAHELAPTEPAGEKRCAGGTRMSAGLISRFGRCFMFATGKPHPSGRRDCFAPSNPFSCLTSSSQTSFHLSLRPRRASTFFRKESRQRFAKGLRPFEPHSCALRPLFPSSALLAGLRGLSAANRRLTGKRLKSQGAELSFSSVSVQRGTPAPFRCSPPFSGCWPA